MGMELRVTSAASVDWRAARDLLAARGFSVQLRMIDGELAFPDEEPADTWRELRLGTPQGMVTVRREPQCLLFVTWGNADVAMQRAWHAVTWAFASAGKGHVHQDAETLTAKEFSERHCLFAENQS